MSNSERSDYYVYALLDPSHDNRPFYVGKGRGWRRINHYCPSYLKKPSHKNHIIKRYRMLGYSDTYKILAEGLTEQEAFKLEVETIQLLGRRDFGGILVNITNGGEGASGYATKRTTEWRAKISAAHIGKIVSTETRKRQSESAKGKIIGQTQRDKISASLKGRVFSDEHRSNLTVSMIGRRLSEEHKRAVVKNLRIPKGKLYWVTDPNGVRTLVKNLAKFCRALGLSNQHLGKVALGRRTHHKGYKAVFVKDVEYA